MRLPRRRIDADPASPQILTRIGELRCEPGSTDAATSALDAFDRALARDPEYGPAFLARARCLEALGRREEALAQARRGAYLDPLRLESTRIVARLLFSLGRRQEAWTWLEARVALEPSSVAALKLLIEAAAREKDPARRASARHDLEALVRRDPLTLDEAIARRDLSAMRRAALARRLSGAMLAHYCLERAPDLALEQALATLRADGQDSDAWTVALVAADRLGDERHFGEALDLLDAEPSRPSPRSLALLSELIERRAGEDAAKAFVESL
jgi:tetratricopeptide (TPR) repeat protein